MVFYFLGGIGVAAVRTFNRWVHLEGNPRSSCPEARAGELLLFFGLRLLDRDHRSISLELNLVLLGV